MTASHSAFVQVAGPGGANICKPVTECNDDAVATCFAATDAPPRQAPIPLDRSTPAIAEIRALVTLAGAALSSVTRSPVVVAIGITAVQV